MKILPVLILTACGYSAKSNEMIGQVKKITEQTPIICGDYIEADLSLGVMRNGVGSLSKEDVLLYVERREDGLILKRAAERGQLVKVTYDIRRVAMCVPDHWLTGVAMVDDPAPVTELLPVRP